LDSVLFPATDAESETVEAFKQTGERAFHLAQQTVSELLDREKVSLCSMKVSRLFLESEVSIHSLKVPQLHHRGW
jgi:hypothetical protein